MAAPVPSRKKHAVPEVRCANCGHGEHEHGQSGTRPCLATIGNLPELGFCLCDDFRPEATRAA